LPNFWGKGIAQELMKLGEERLKIDSQVQVVNATVLNENKASMALFEKAQFNPFLTKFKKNI
jgi:RimJ/RimL family protein N-acetyltransferase